MTPKDKAQAELAALPIQVGQWFKHYKGGEYEVVALGVKEDALEPMVIYRSPQHNDTVWVRTYENFVEQVEVEGNKVPRFTAA